MQLTHSVAHPRLTRRFWWHLPASLVFSLFLSAHAVADAPKPDATQAPPASTPAVDPNADVLGNLVVTAGSTRTLPKVAVLPSLSADAADVTLRNVVQRDLDLCGEFELLPDSEAPTELSLTSSKVDVKIWGSKGVEAVIKVSAKTEPTGVTLTARAYLVKKGNTPVFEKVTSTSTSSVREESHRIADLVIGALSGQNGGFASQMTFISGAGQIRRLYRMDADGHDARAVSPLDQLAIGAAFGKNEELQWIASVDNEEYKVRTAAGAMTLTPKGSVYGLAYSKDRSQVAVSISVKEGIKMFSGADLLHLQPASEVRTALSPAFSPNGKLAFSGAGKVGQRIFVDGKAATPEGIFASNPTFCNHPDGVKMVFEATIGRQSDLAVTGEQGGGLGRLTQNQGSNSSPACSPDGRLVAFFSTRTSGEGPGLYIMRVDGRRPKRISTLVGNSLRWSPLPPPVTPATATPTPTAQPSTTPAAQAATSPPAKSSTDTR